MIEAKELTVFELMYFCERYGFELVINDGVVTDAIPKEK